MHTIEVVAEDRGDDGGGRNLNLRQVGLGVGDADEHHLGRDGPAAGHRMDVEEQGRGCDVHVRKERQTCLGGHRARPR